MAIPRPTARSKGVKRLKREYSSARRHYNDLVGVLEGLQGSQAYLPPGILDPAIDLMFDKVELARKPYEEATAACRERGIRRVEGCHIPHTPFHVDDLDTDEIDGDDGD